ncbi:MAG: DUF2279 domain-containing protein [Bacteroidales bacterium]|nr:DUF2279 domain-containing protein [Bacteroidales bacterium]
MMKKIIFILLATIYINASGQESAIVNQQPIDSLRLKKNLGIVFGTEAVIYTGSMTGLYYLWYADYPQSSFHFYNDNAEWLQMDKAGHATTAYHVGMIGYEALRLAGWDEKKSLLYGGPLGFVFLTTVEVFDGLSDGWGFSLGDMAANAIGTGLFMGQQALWKEQRISMKYSYHHTQFAQYRPDLLGNTLPEKMLKDYNGQTIWLSFNIKSLFMNDESRFPSWINMALGYSAEGMTGAFYNTNSHNGQPIPEFDRVRQFIFSPDIDLTRIPVKNKFLKSTLKVLSFIKIPMPAVMCDSQGNFSWHWLYF